MVKRAFHVTAIWDDEAGLYVADSDIIGLHIETSSIDEFEEIMLDVAPELIVANDTANAILRDAGSSKRM